MAWKGETEIFSYGISHKLICPLLKQWRQVAKGKATVESAGVREAMMEYLKASVSGAGVSREGGRLEHGLRAHVYECVLSRAERVGSRGEEKRDDWTSACGDIHAGSNNAVA